MKPIDTPATNRRLQPPLGWDETRNGPCFPLPVHQAGAAMHSYWKPDAHDLAQLNAGLPVRLSIAGSLQYGHPVVALEVAGPLAE